VWATWKQAQMPGIMAAFMPPRKNAIGSLLVRANAHLPSPPFKEKKLN